ncbi:ABC transporter substrate-binding protein [Ramlibacter sp. MMS24-I3-19]|uniref:ABC transporter substrate-binding protein n=1 Tax=Ramlibacter sp. MMS24-I3-19 TaxID=3416606 RepID=UPI003D042B99
MHANVDASRRRLMGSLLAGVAGGGTLLSVDASATAPTRLHLQLGWLAGVNQAGEVVAQRMGFYEQEGLQLSMQPGGPHVDGVAIVASGHMPLGQVSSSPSLMLAASQGLPVRCFAVGAQRHPYTYFSLRRNPVRRPADLVGKRVGVQPTGLGLLRAVLARHRIPEKDVHVVPMGAEVGPLLTGQVDVVTGWLTSTATLKLLGRERVDMPLWDTGIRLYALPYYANTHLLRNAPHLLAAFVRATARGWNHARMHPEHAVDMLVETYPTLDRDDQRHSLTTMLAYSFADAAASEGWGAMEPEMWQEQIALYSQLGLFTAAPPRLADVMTMEILDATRAARGGA